MVKTIPDFEQLKSIVKRLGLSELEQRVFLFLLFKRGKVRVTRIARDTKLNRTTLYGILRELKDRGLVSSYDDHRVLAYEAISPHSLVAYIARSSEQLATDARTIDTLIPQIEKERASEIVAFPSIQFFEGIDGIKEAYEDSLRNNPSKQIVGFTGTEAIYEAEDTEPGWAAYYMKRRTAAKVRWRTIASNSDASRHMQSEDDKVYRKTKILPEGFNFGIEIGVYEQKVLIASYDRDHPLGILIKDKKIAETMRALFNYIDSTLKE